MAKKASYIAPNGEFIPGIPARDLTAEEWDAIDPEIRKGLVENGVYAEQGKPKIKVEDDE